ncbi:MAG: filamentous hemagglutinin N-terminal domain-containing protein, partial [Candidatus Omnitrophica bacterium]|nr:filamentous hemagglutinin N-terminal domain-containing protein [Candidatus Omnitrophota bacterium]
MGRLSTTNNVGKILRRYIILCSAIFFLLHPAFNSAHALPEIDGVVSGDVEFSRPNDQTLNINASNKAIINYKSFDIGENESVIVNLPDATSEILNRAVGASASSILGSLSCNGVFLLVNPNGIVFGPNANVDVQGLIASTRDITNSDFLSSQYRFEKLSKDQLDTLLVNRGTINIRQGGFGVLIAGAVESSGTIICPLGTVAMAGADKVTLNIAGNGSISIAIDKAVASTIVDAQGKPITSQLKNTGRIEANGGVVLLKAEALPGIFEKAINLEGYVRADRLEGKDGTVKLVSSGKVVVN